MDVSDMQAAIVAALNAAAATTAGITRFIRTTRAAYADLVRVSRELSDLRLDLELLRDEPGVPAAMQPGAAAVLDSCRGLIRRVDGLLAACRPASAGQPADWTANEKRSAAAIATGLQCHREVLALVSQVTNLVASGPADAKPGEVEAKDILFMVTHARDIVERTVPDKWQATLIRYLDEITASLSVPPSRSKSRDRKRSPVVDLKKSFDNLPEVIRTEASRSTSARSSPKPSSPRPPRAMFEAPVSKFAQTSTSSASSPAKEDSPARSTASSPRSRLGQPFEAVGPWFPPADVTVPYYQAPQSGPAELGADPDVSPKSNVVRRHRDMPNGHAHMHTHIGHLGQPLPAPDRPLPRLPVRSPPPPGVASSPRLPPPPPPPQPTYSPPTPTPATLQPPIESPPRPRESVSTRSSSILVIDQLPPLPHKRTSSQPSIDSNMRESMRESVSTKATSIFNQMKMPLAQFRTKRKSSAQSVAQSALSVESVASSPTSHHSGKSVAASTLHHFPFPSPPTIKHTPQTSPNRTPVPSEAKLEQPQSVLDKRIEVVRSERLADSTKGQSIVHVDVSPGCRVIATRHTNSSISVWSTITGAVEATINTKLKVQVMPRSRMFFIRSHAIVSEPATLIAISTSFGNTIEIWDWARKKRVQTIDRASRWAMPRSDAFVTPWSPLAVYRDEPDRIDLMNITRGATDKPFWVTRSIELRKAELPFLPRYPELAYSATGPLLVGAAGPRPGAPADEQKTLLMAWQVDSLRSDSHKPYRILQPDHPELDGALPSSLVTYGSVAVSIWLPTNLKHVAVGTDRSRKVPVKVTNRYVLIWDLAANTTRLLTIPNVEACVSPDCRLLAYCGAEAGRFVVLDTMSGEEVWAWPDADGGVLGRFPQLDHLDKVAHFGFSDDGGLLTIGDTDGGVVVYMLRELGKSEEGAVGMPWGQDVGQHAV